MNSLDSKPDTSKLHHGAISWLGPKVRRSHPRTRWDQQVFDGGVGKIRRGGHRPEKREYGQPRLAGVQVVGA